MLQLTFNPGLTLTDFRTTRPSWLIETRVKVSENEKCSVNTNLVPRGRDPFGQRRGSSPLADLWPGPTPEVRKSRISRHSAHAQSHVWQIWLVLVSIYCVYKAIQNRNVVGPCRGPDFQRMTKGTPGDELWEHEQPGECFRSFFECFCNSKETQTTRSYFF